ncbi:MAG: hypothetical protein KAU94_10205, partial [Verrucomicrobia bacterium]|nr:hypothetical protein [Verrucomicrobiota bacterium]
MKKTMRLSVLAMGVAVAGVQGYSNPIEGGTTEFVTNQWTVAMPWLMVGGNSSSNMLFVADGGRVDSQLGIIGNNATSMGNSAFVSGSNAVWNSSMEIAVGNQGSDNTLGVFGGGRVDTANAYIGKASSNNFASISGSGSELNATTLHVGHTGSDNALGIFDGGRVSSGDGSIGYWIGSDDNSVLVTGTNSVWNNTGILNVGEHGSDNLLMIVDGGTVQSPVVNLGVQSYSSNNAISVWGDGALLNATELNIGGSAAGAGGTGNRVSVRDGGTVATTDLNIYTGNNFDLNDGGRLAVSTNFNAAMTGFNFNSGGTLEVGGELTGMGSTIEDQRMIVMNGSDALWDRSGSSLYVGKDTSGNSMVATNGALIQSSGGHVGYGSSSSGNTVTVAGSNSMWNSTGRIDVGYQGDGNTLIITNGGQVVAEDVIAAYSAASSGNRIVVSGEGSKLITPRGGVGVAVGLRGSNNHMVVEDGAMVETMGSFGHVILGYYSGSDNNTMLVDDASINLSQNMYVGLYGAGNHMTITNGGVVRASNGTVVGRHASSDGNSAIVTGSGSLLESKTVFSMGSSGSGNTFIVADGGEVRSDIGYIGTHGTARDNTMLVTGLGSKWVATNELYVGHEGSNNHLSIEDGGRVEDRIGHIGYASGADNNAALVSGQGSVWQNNEALYLGGHKSGDNWVNGGTGNSLTVENRSWVLIGNVDSNNLPNTSGYGFGRIVVGDTSGSPEMIVANGSEVNSNYGYVGLGSNESGMIEVTGGSVWNNSLNLYVGYKGVGSRLFITDGGMVQGETGSIGFYGSDSNAVLVSGDGSIWSNSRRLYIGQDGDGNTLEITDGGVVQNDASYLGSGNSSDNNTVLVSGMGSLWNSRTLSIGEYGSGNSLVITNGGMVSCGYSLIGYRSGSDNNVLVSGVNSVWTNASLTVGLGGDGNTLEIRNGGVVYSKESKFGYGGDGVIGGGQFVSGNSNAVVVSGMGSAWYVGKSLTVGGGGGTGHRLEIVDGGGVYNVNGFVSDSGSSGNNAVMVSGEGSVWNNSEDWSVGRG